MRWLGLEVLCLLASGAVGARLYMRDRLIFDHIEQFDCETSPVQECRERCVKSSHCKTPSNEKALYDIAEWRRCLKDLSAQCEYNFTMFTGLPATLEPVKVVPISDSKSTSSTTTTTTKKGSEIVSTTTTTIAPSRFEDSLSIMINGSLYYVVAPGYDYRFGVRISYPSPDADKLDRFPEDCSEAKFSMSVVTIHDKQDSLDARGEKVDYMELKPKFINDRKFMVLMINKVLKAEDGDDFSSRQWYTLHQIQVTVNDAKYRHCLIQNVKTVPKQAFTVVESYFIVTGYNENHGFIKENERGDFFIGSHPSHE